MTSNCSFGKWSTTSGFSGRKTDNIPWISYLRHRPNWLLSANFLRRLFSRCINRHFRIRLFHCTSYRGWNLQLALRTHWIHSLRCWRFRLKGLAVRNSFRSICKSRYHHAAILSRSELSGFSLKFNAVRLVAYTLQIAFSMLAENINRLGNDAMYTHKRTVSPQCGDI